METFIYEGKEYFAEISEDNITIRRQGRRLCVLIPTTAVTTVTEADGEFTQTGDTLEKITGFAPLSESAFRWTTESSLWKKEYIMEFDSEGFTYTVTLSGSGKLGKADYFGGISGEEQTTGSRYGFCDYFFPCPGCFEFKPPYRSSVTSYRSFFELLIPPPYVYSFRTEGVDGRFGLGLIAKEGEYNFIHFDYEKVSVGPRTNFFLSTDFEGHTVVDGDFELPKIRAFFGGSDIDIVRKYSDYHFDTGLCRKNDFTNVPRWWHGPIVCGWNEQGVQAEAIDDGRSQQGMAAQDIYMKIAGMIEEHNIRPTILIIDDKWQQSYGNCIPDPERWQDMRAFTDEMHRRGIHTLLWFRLWGGEGLPEDEVMYGEGMPYAQSTRLNYPPYADPTNEKYRAHLKKLLRLLLSDEEGCMNADGFKLDYSLVMPYGKTAKSAGGKYGAEMTKELYKLIYETAKEIKPDALINGSPCHPYFAEVCDQARLHDYGWAYRNETEQMRLRADLFRAAMPGVLIDTDSVNFTDEDDAMYYYRNMPEIGIPDIYQFSNTEHFCLTDENWREIEKIFNDYSDKMDSLYGKA